LHTSFPFVAKAALNQHVKADFEPSLNSRYRR